MLFIDYLPAELKPNKSRWYVSYHVKNPATGKLHRKTVKVNRIKNISERKKYAKKLVLEINNKLQSGWNPFIEQEAPKAYTKLIAALDIYLNHKTKEFTSKDSIRTYKSHIEVLKDYILNVIKEPDMLAISFDTRHVNNYMNYLYMERNVSGRTFNNYKRFAVSIWNFLIEHLYCKSNPFKTVSKKRVKDKTRTIIDIDTLTRIKDYLLNSNEIEYLAIVMLCNHGLIRPKEICLLKPGNIKLSERLIVLTKEMTKDNDNRIVTISNELFTTLERLNIEQINKDSYLFSKNFKPGRLLIDSRLIAKKWDKLRKELNFDMKYQFYSLKDTGIVTMLKDRVPSIEVRDQAGHSSLEQTEKYAKYANPTGSDFIKKL